MQKKIWPNWLLLKQKWKMLASIPLWQKNEAGQIFSSANLTVEFGLPKARKVKFPKRSKEDLIEKPQYIPEQPPRFVQVPRLMTAHVGEVCTMVFKVLAKPNPIVTITHNGYPVVNTERKYIDIEVLSDYAITSINMKIGRSEYDDGGQYKILAKNKYGEAEYLLDLRVQRTEVEDYLEVKKMLRKAKTRKDIMYGVRQQDFRDILFEKAVEFDMEQFQAEQAALKIQAAFRGHRARRMVSAKRKE